MSGAANTPLIDDLMLMAEQAVILHSDMTDDQDAHENFIRNQIAIGLYTRRKKTVSMELGRIGFIKDVAEKEKKTDFEQLTAEQWRDLSGKRPRNFKLDLIVWHATYPEPCYPEALVEVKKGQSFDDDVKSISRLLDYCHSTTIGYVVECLICREGEILTRKQTLERRIEQTKGICGKSISSAPIHLSPSDVWCVTSVTEVLRQ
jgi:hypothetical protein